MSKKSESLEVRVSHEMKDQLRRASQAEGESTSSVLRTLIEGFIAAPGDALQRHSSLTRWSLRAKILVVSTVLLITFIFAAIGVGQLDYFTEGAREFRQLDANRDGYLNAPEIELSRGSQALDLISIDLNGDGLVSLAEYRARKAQQTLEAYDAIISARESEDGG